MKAAIAFTLMLALAGCMGPTAALAAKDTDAAWLASERVASGQAPGQAPRSSHGLLGRRALKQVQVLDGGADAPAAEGSSTPWLDSSAPGMVESTGEAGTTMDEDVWLNGDWQDRDMDLMRMAGAGAYGCYTEVPAYGTYGYSLYGGEPRAPRAGWGGVGWGGVERCC